MTNNIQSFAGIVDINGIDEASSTSTGALQVAGGAGIAGKLYVGGAVSASSFSGTGSLLTSVNASTVTLSGDTSSVSRYILFADNATGNNGLKTDTDLTYVPSTNKLSVIAEKATILETARTIGGVSFNGSANINLPGVNVVGNQDTTGSAASLTTARTINGVAFDGTTNITLPASSSATLTPGGFLTGSNYDGSVARTFAVDATITNTGNKIVARDSSANIYVNKCTGTIGEFTIRIYVSGTTDSTDASGTTGALQIVGGASIGKKLYVGGVTNITNTTASTSTTTGALIVSGGVGVGGDVNVSGNMTVTGGNVGIGTTQPHAPLTVYGIGGSLTGGTSRTYFLSGTLPNNSGSGWSASSTSDDLGIYSVNTIASGVAFLAMNGTFGASDERIKKDIIDIDDGSALDTLRLLKPKQYKYKDYIRCGTDPVWGFIAQEVRDTLPYATQTRFECIPNIYELSNVSDSNVITFTNFDTSSLVSNVMVLKVYDKDDKEHLINITEVLNDHSIRVDEDLSEWSGTVDGNEGEKIFVYGQQVNDFIYIKKESIWTVAAAALQEVDRQQLLDKARIATLESQYSNLLARVTALENV